MDEAMHIRCIDVVLLIERCRGKHDIGIEARGGHAEIKVDQKVELANGSLSPFDELGHEVLFFGGKLFANDAVLSTHEMFEEVLLSFARGTQDVRAPDEEVARPIEGLIEVFKAEADIAALERIDKIVLRCLAICLCLFSDVDGVDIELWSGGEPSHLHALEVAIYIGAAIALRIGKRGAHIGKRHAFIAPLIGMLIEVACCVHMA